MNIYPSEIRKMKKQPGKGMAILGSGSIVSQLAPEGLIDEYQVVVNPVVLGKGRTMFDGIKEMLTLKLTKTRTFANGTVFLCYESDGVKEDLAPFARISVSDMRESKGILGYRMSRSE